MSWIPSHKELASHPKTKRLARLLGVEPPAAIGHLHLLWWWADDYAPDGELEKFDRAEIAEAILWAGNADMIIGALIQARFLDLQGDKLKIHGWNDPGHTGGFRQKYTERADKNAQRQREWREKKKNEYAGKVEY